MVCIESLDQDGRGVTRIDGKVTFVEGGLPGEVVVAETVRRKRSFDLAKVVQILQPSSQRVAPRCPHYERCGGCKLQHLEPRAQVAIKQRVLEEDLKRIGAVRPEHILAPIHGPVWAYRHRARFAVKHVARKNGVLVGFHERRTHFVADMDSCEVLPARVSALIRPLRALVTSMELAARIPQIEIAVGESAVALSFRVLDTPGDADLTRLQAFGRAQDVDIYLQGGGPDTLRPLDPHAVRALYYALPEFDLSLHFAPFDFTQVNPAVNRVLVHRAVEMMALAGGERVADLFCGVGNFALALARRGAQVTGVEGSGALIERARDNASRNGLTERTQFIQGDLFERAGALLARLGPLDGLLIDPPRDGAYAVVQAIESARPRRLVYVSCNPATLARDAGVLVHQKGYRMRSVGVVNMFPHTAHVESIALFELA